MVSLFLNFLALCYEMERCWVIWCFGDNDVCVDIEGVDLKPMYQSFDIGLIEFCYMPQTYQGFILMMVLGHWSP